MIAKVDTAFLCNAHRSAILLGAMAGNMADVHTLEAKNVVTVEYDVNGYGTIILNEAGFDEWIKRP